MNPKASRWRKTPFPLYDDMHFLVHGIVATGAEAFHAGSQPQPPSLSISQSYSLSPSWSQSQSQSASQPPATPLIGNAPLDSQTLLAVPRDPITAAPISILDDDMANEIMSQSPQVR